MACLSFLSLTAYSVNVNSNIGTRLNLLITLVLTAVAFSYVVFDNLPKVPYQTILDKYILSCYFFMVCGMIESAIVGLITHGNHIDYAFFWISLVAAIGYHLLFVWIAINARKKEEEKLSLSSDEVEQEVNMTRPTLQFDYRKFLRAGVKGRLLSFLAAMQIPDKLPEQEKQQLQQEQKLIHAAYEGHARQFAISHADENVPTNSSLPNMEVEATLNTPLVTR